jgi:predicted DNA-binding transcriptional regulator YafY
VSQTERIHHIVHLLEGSRRPVPIARFLDELEVSRATFRRDIEYLRDRLGAPIEWQRGAPDRPSGYVLRGDDLRHGDGFGIRGLWFNQSEIYALLMMHQLAGSMEPGLITAQSQALLARITHLLGTADDDPEAVLSFVRILHSATKRRSSSWFEVIARATVRRRRLTIVYYTRSRDATGERTVSPQRLLHYRENWYLLAWCHRVQDLRLFALDAIRHAELHRQPARQVGQRRLEEAMGSGFGIFGGPAVHRARLRFSPDAARWIADEVWHPQQRLSWQDGHLIMELPYAQSRELAMEILRHGSDVEVLEPESLRGQVRTILQQTLAHYRDTLGRDDLSADIGNAAAHPSVPREANDD